MLGWKEAVQMMTRKERVNHILQDWAELDMGLASWLAEVAYDRRRISLSFLFVACVGPWSKKLADHWTTNKSARAMVTRGKEKSGKKSPLESPCDVWQCLANPFQVHGPFHAPMSCASRSKYLLLVGTGSGLQTCISVLIGLAAHSHAKVTLVGVTSDQVAYENYFRPLLRRLTDTDLGIRVLIYCGWHRTGEDSAIDLVAMLMESAVTGPVAGLVSEEGNDGSAGGRSSVAAEAAVALRMELYRHFSTGGFSNGYLQPATGLSLTSHDLPLQTSIDLFVSAAQLTVAEFKTNTTWEKIGQSFCEAYEIMTAVPSAEMHGAKDTEAGQCTYPYKAANGKSNALSDLSRAASGESRGSTTGSLAEQISEALIQATKQILPGLLSAWSLSAPGADDHGGSAPGVDDLVNHVDDRELQPNWEGLIEKKQGMDKVSYAKLMRALHRVKVCYDTTKSQLVMTSSGMNRPSEGGTCCPSLRRRFGLGGSKLLRWTGDSISFDMFEAALLGAATELTKQGRGKASTDAGVAMHVPHLLQPRAGGDPLGSWEGQLQTRPSFPDFASVWRLVKEAAVMDWTRVVKSESVKRRLDQQREKEKAGISRGGGERKDADMPHVAVFYSGAQIRTSNALMTAAHRHRFSFQAESFNY